MATVEAVTAVDTEAVTEVVMAVDTEVAMEEGMAGGVMAMTATACRKEAITAD